MVADELDRLDAGLVALVDLEDEVDAAVRQVDRAAYVTLAALRPIFL